MKRFRFRLQRVLDYRNMLKKEEERTLALKNSELRSAEEKLEYILHSQESVEIPQREHMTMAELTITGDYLRFLQESLIEQRLHVLDAAEAVDRAREAYIERAIEAKSLETLKEQKARVHQEEKKRHEQKEADKLTVQRHRFKSGGIKSGEDNG